MSRLESLQRDIPAAIVVVFVAIPLCLGIALASGAPAFAGLIAGIVGGIVVGSLSGSPLGVSGPAAGLAVIVANAIADLGSFETFLVAVVLAGGVQILLGLARAGVLAYFFPSSVIKGMLSGIGILIVLKQLPHAVGHDSDPEGELSFVQPDGETTLTSLSAIVDDFSISAIVVAAVCLAILILWETVLTKRGGLFKLVQGPLVAVAFGIAFEWATQKFAPGWALARDHLVRVPIADGLSGFAGLLTYPDWSQLWRADVWTVAVTVAVVASLETLLCVEATDKLDPRKRVTPTNRELVAQGCGNMLSGAIGGLPVTQVIVRSSANIQSGGRTKLSAILHGVFLFLLVLLAPKVLNLVPKAALAAILLVVGYKLAKPALFKEMFARGPAQYLPFLITVIAILCTDLLMGIGLGMAAALFVILRNQYLNSHWLHIREHDNDRHEVTMQLAEEVTFLNRAAILKELARIPNGSEVTLDASGTWRIDRDVLDVIDDFEQGAPRRDITVHRIGRFSSRPDPADQPARDAS